MEYVAIIFIFIIGLLDSFFFILLLNNPVYLEVILGIHIFLVMLIMILHRKFLKRYEGIPNYLVFFLPGLGGIIVSILHFSLYYFLRSSIVLEDYERYIDFERFFEYRKLLDYHKEMQTLSFLDHMNLLDAESKKQLIIDFSMNNYDSRVKLLQKGLIDQDTEVKHYSAVSLNVIENEYVQLINELREAYNLDKEPGHLRSLVKVYQSYIESGLLTDEVQIALNEEYISVLHKLIELKKETSEIIMALIQAYVKGNHFEKAQKWIERYIDKRPDSFEPVYYLLHIAYMQKDLNKVDEIVKNLENNNINIPEEYQDKILYWTEIS